MRIWSINSLQNTYTFQAQMTGKRLLKILFTFTVKVLLRVSTFYFYLSYFFEWLLLLLQKYFFTQVIVLLLKYKISVLFPSLLIYESKKQKTKCWNMEIQGFFLHNSNNMCNGPFADAAPPSLRLVTVGSSDIQGSRAATAPVSQHAGGSYTLASWVKPAWRM